jgi:hypothetical protein
MTVIPKDVAEKKPVPKWYSAFSSPWAKVDAFVLHSMDTRRFLSRLRGKS